VSSRQWPFLASLLAVWLAAGCAGAPPGSHEAAECIGAPLPRSNGSFVPAPGHGTVQDRGVTVLGRWEAPPGRAKYGAGGSGPFPPSWPTLAVIVTTETEPEVVRNCVLFLAAGPDIGPEDTTSRLISHAWFAWPCIGGETDFVGKWVDFGDFEPMFVFLSPTGGTAGTRVVVFAHGVLYQTGRRQSHSFAPVFDSASGYGVYLGDVNGDKRPELIVPSAFSNMTHPANYERVFGVYGWLEGVGFTQVEETTQSALSKLQEAGRVTEMVREGYRKEAQGRQE